MRISFNEEVLAEAEEATRWYRDNGGASPSRAFTQELRRVVQLAAGQPNIGAPGPHGTTRLDFKTVPVHIDFPDSRIMVRAIAVAHQSRRPGYWVGRH